MSLIDEVVSFFFRWWLMYIEFLKILVVLVSIIWVLVYKIKRELFMLLDFLLLRLEWDCYEIFWLGGRCFDCCVLKKRMFLFRVCL